MCMQSLCMWICCMVNRVSFFLFCLLLCVCVCSRIRANTTVFKTKACSVPGEHELKDMAQDHKLEQFTWPKKYQNLFNTFCKLNTLLYQWEFFVAVFSTISSYSTPPFATKKIHPNNKLIMHCDISFILHY